MQDPDEDELSNGRPRKSRMCHGGRAGLEGADESDGRLHTSGRWMMDHGGHRMMLELGANCPESDRQLHQAHKSKIPHRYLSSTGTGWRCPSPSVTLESRLLLSALTVVSLALSLLLLAQSHPLANAIILPQPKKFALLPQPCAPSTEHFHVATEHAARSTRSDNSTVWPT